MTDLNKKLDRLQKRERIRHGLIIAVFPVCTGLIAYFAFWPADTAFRFVQVKGAQFQADDSGPR